ncbi:MAG TPA: amidohydrolase family protein, partial [Bacteroidales bacterium]|nr:amidohydrolase family protein [Bacteroidales bacterium]
IALKMAYNPAKKFNIKDRGELKVGNYADITVVDLNIKSAVKKENLLYKCKWSFFEGVNFTSSVVFTIVNGNIVFENGKLNDHFRGMLIEYNQTK